MKKICRNAFGLLFVGALLVACSSSRNAIPSPVGLVPLTSFDKISKDNSSDTAYHIIQNDETFSANFKAASADTKNPNFVGQQVAVLVTPQPSLLRFERAEYSGSRMNIYLWSCTLSEPACRSSNFFLATIPRVGSTRSVQFFINNVGKEVVNL